MEYYGVLHNCRISKIFYKDTSYRILYIIENEKVYDNEYFCQKMRTVETARKFAEYRVREHLAGRNIIRK